jgi:hypothetical protein
MVTLAIVLSFLLGGACLVIAALLFAGAKSLRESEPVAPAVTPSVPVAAAPVVAPPEPPLVPETVAIRLVSNGGRHLGDTVIPLRARRVNLQRRVGKARELSTFVASHKDGEAWTYRRVGVERE